MADQETKFSEEELKSLQDLQTSYQQKQLQFGQLEVQRLLVSQQLEQLDNAKAKLEVEYGEVQETERTLVQSLNEKYGPGNLDPATGVFTPTPAAEVPETTEETT
jgi:outer membrane protein TolC